MDHAVEEDNGDIFIYRGGRAPLHVTHARIDKSVDEIENHAFNGCRNLLTVETHDGIRRVGKFAFYNCKSLRWINLKSAVEIGDSAFNACVNLETVEFGDRLEIIGGYAFDGCTSLTNLKLPTIITIGAYEFDYCTSLTDVELPERLETIGACTFWRCKRIQRIAIPLKRDLFVYDGDNHEYNQFSACEQLATVDIVGGIDKTVASLHMESWRTEMIEEINRINQVLPNSRADDKTEEIQQWMELVHDRLDHYKAEHCRYVKEGLTLLELALWKAKLGEKEDNCEEGRTKKAKIDTGSYRRDKRITCGADMVIKNVLPYLQLE